MKRSIPSIVAIALALVLTSPSPAQDDPAHPDITLFFQAASTDAKISRAALKELEKKWSDGYAPMFIDLARLMRPPSRRPGPGSDRGAPGSGPEPGAFDGENVPLSSRSTDRPISVNDPGSPVRRRLLQFLKKRTGQKFGDDLDAWRRWMWARPYEPHPDYAFFKAGVYRNIDPRFAEFLFPDREAAIRLDEIDWGGVRVNGVPPLDHPAILAAQDAAYLDDGDIVFGVKIEGAPRAYPRRIVAWHELVRDTVGGTDIALVYCTLCGSVVPYESRLGEESLTFGTSGLLYRSNKLMFDEESMTLWSSLYGKPVVGPRVGEDVRLRRYPVTTTTWGEWKAMHPKTTVLSLETGHDRDYSEGAAYSDYASSERIWFEVPAIDDRLGNKDEVVTLELDGLALAISREYLKRNRVHHHALGGRSLLFATTESGTTRVYEVGARRIREWGSDRTLLDEAGDVWRVEEDALVSADGVRLIRVPTSPAYWFGWYAQYPETELVK